ncbi:apiosidase-like domain-containing protein [Wenyingzhuangia sp. IMCC45574]
MRKYQATILFTILLVSVFSFGQQKVSYQQKISASKWSVIDISFHTKRVVKTPFEVVFGAVFTHETGKTMDVAGFFNGNKEYVIRFSPELEGKWSFTTYASLKSLSGKDGVLTISPNENKNQHGPIVISKNNKQKFAYANGKPYFLLAFELDWLFALDWDNQKDIPKTKEIIHEVKQNGFNQVVMNVYAYDATWGRKKIDPKTNFAKPKVFPFGGSNEKPDYSTLNIDFFQHLDRVIEHLDEQGLICHLMIYVWNKQVNWPKAYSKEDNRYFDYVVKRYQAYPNIMWDISKEALGYGHDDIDYITNRIERLKKLESHKRLVSVHDYHYCSTFPEKVDYISTQNWVPNIYDQMLSVKKEYANKPIFNIEHGGYETTMHSVFGGAYSDPVVCLDRNYKCVFAGSYSTYYWQNTSWYEIITKPFDLPKEQQPFFSYYKNMADLFNKYNFTHLEPAQKGFGTYALSDHKNTYLFYLPSGLDKINGNRKELKGKTIKITWFNPLTGEYISKGKKKMNSAWMGFARPSELKSSMAIGIIEVVE